MYKIRDKNQMSIDGYDRSGDRSIRLDPNNEWVRLSEIIPWDEIEQIYLRTVSQKTGRMATPARVAFGALFIKIKEGISNEKCVREIRDNPFMQYFLGLEEYRNEPPFTPSMMTQFRRRFPADLLAKIGECIRTGRWPEDGDGAERGGAETAAPGPGESQ